MNGNESLRANFPGYAEGCTVDDLLWLAAAAAQELSNRGLTYASELAIAESHVRELWKRDRGARTVEQFRRGTSGEAGAY